ncbi:hypothetical protein sscle_06g049730 [Sclerotinia sclerotiorum 1980 UF-70]|uniref:Rhodopsin domain-containing protein n=1 Tax=Sclerotinia sclerotiorum (strain ATCC 18683 / 1980 / Ss-1) TaxID=665079 RepID=A0A1D9Q6J6_SCLS1|nr:hypothetical protein sscle_06g049730 [Sclerotinia sclerotiorum 1980 UF-70]
MQQGTFLRMLSAGSTRLIRLIPSHISVPASIVTIVSTKNTTTTGRFIRYDDWWILAAYLTYASHCMLIICDITKISDVVILALPFFVIKDLHVPVRKKVLLFLVFWFGGFVIVTCILRIKYSYQPHDAEHFSGFSTANEWLMIEEGSAILGACVPTFRPILKACFKLPKPINDWFSSAPGTLGPASKFSNGHVRLKNQPSRLNNGNGNESSFQLKKISPAYIQHGGERRSHDHDEDLGVSSLADNRIWVTRHTTITG